MVAWWQRILYSAVSVLVAAIICSALSLLLPGRTQPLLDAFIFVMFWTTILCIPAWLLMIPVLLTLQDLHGWRVRVFLAVGICIGPISLLLVELYIAFNVWSTGAGFRLGIGFGYFFCMAAAVSSLSTLSYLILFRRAQAAKLKRSQCYE
jgi:hypothetical protein